MEIGLMCRGGIDSYTESLVEGEKTAKLLVFGFQAIGEVSYEKELRGETAFFEDVALLSRETGGVVVCGLSTDARGHKRKSAVVAENGRILGVSDMTNVIDGEWGSGACLCVYDTSQGKIGVLVGEDLYFPETVKSLAACGSDIIVCAYSQVLGNIESVLARAYAFLYGLPVVICGEGYSVIASSTGEVAFSSAENHAAVELPINKEYHLVERRTRGFSKPKRGEY